MAYIEKTYNYVYTVKLPETNEFYHGSRACYVLPEKDKYIQVHLKNGNQIKII